MTEADALSWLVNSVDVGSLLTLAQDAGASASGASASGASGDGAAGAADPTANGASPPAGSSGSGGIMSFLPMILGMVFIFYFLVIRPNQKEVRERDDLLSGLKKGDKIVTRGGLIGRVAEIREKEVVLRVDEPNNTRVHIYKSFVLAKLDDKGSDSQTEDKLNNP